MIKYFGRSPVSLFMITLVTIATQAPIAFAKENGEAFYIQPMEFQMKPSRSDGRNSLRIVNNDQHDATIRIDVFERSDRIDGAEERSLSRDIRVEATDFLVPAGKSREIGITYHGKKKIDREHAYRIVVKQVGGATGVASQTLDVRFVYVASVYVTPNSARPKLVVEKVRQTSERRLEIDLRNEGKAHQKMRDVSARLEESLASGPREIEISDESRLQWAKLNVLAGSRRTVVLELRANETVRSPKLNLKLIRAVRKTAEE